MSEASNLSTSNSLAGLDNNQREAVRTYCTVTETQSTDEAVRVLSSTGWNVQDAVERYLSGQTQAAPAAAPPRNVARAQPVPSSGRRGSTTVVSVSGRRGRHASHWLVRVLIMPLRALCSIFRRFNLTFWRLLGGHSRALAEAEGNTPWERFRSFYEARHGTVHPRFYEGSLLSAIAQAQNDAVFVLVYLHSESHSATQAFCSRVMANQMFVDLIDNADFIFWAGDIAQRDGTAAQTAFRASGFPFLALVNPPSRSVSSIAGNENLPSLSSAHFGRVMAYVGAPYSGSIRLEDAVNWVQNALETHRPVLDRVRETRATRERDRQIIAEQNMEYEESLRADRERERVAREEAERAREEERKAEERETRRRRKKEALGTEPEKGAGICSIVLRLPNGTRVQRRFDKDDCLERVFDWAEVNCVDIEVACLVSQFPRKRYKYPEDAGITLVAAGLFPSAMLLLEERDETE